MQTLPEMLNLPKTFNSAECHWKQCRMPCSWEPPENMSPGSMVVRLSRSEAWLTSRHWFQKCSRGHSPGITKNISERRSCGPQGPGRRNQRKNRKMGDAWICPALLLHRRQGRFRPTQPWNVRGPSPVASARPSLVSPWLGHDIHTDRHSGFIHSPDSFRAIGSAERSASAAARFLRWRLDAIVRPCVKAGYRRVRVGRVPRLCCFLSHATGPNPAVIRARSQPIFPKHELVAVRCLELLSAWHE